jgi:two-component system, LuxR family, sensor kinase FixL
LQLMLRRQGTPNPAVLEILDDIISEDKRAGDVIQRMRRLLKKEIFDWVPVDLNAIVQDVTRLMGHEATQSGVELVADLAPGLPATQGDRVQLQQVMLNLVQNGVHAAAGRRHPNGGVRVATVLDGAQVTVSVRDSGPGIDAATLPRLFDPFFTTKAKGLGLGLAISRTIVEQHGGSIEARNTPGSGAEFSVRLPAAGAAA